MNAVLKRAPRKRGAAPKTAPLYVGHVDLFAVPKLAKGKSWAGVVLKDDGTLDYHLIALPGEFDGTWSDALAWAKKQGGALPNRREAQLLWVNASRHFNKDRWHWTSEQHADSSNYACVQDLRNRSPGFRPGLLPLTRFRS